MKPKDFVAVSCHENVIETTTDMRLGSKMGFGLQNGPQ